MSVPGDLLLHDGSAVEVLSSEDDSFGAAHQSNPHTVHMGIECSSTKADSLESCAQLSDIDTGRLGFGLLSVATTKSCQASDERHTSGPMFFATSSTAEILSSDDEGGCPPRAAEAKPSANRNWLQLLAARCAEKKSLAKSERANNPVAAPVQNTPTPTKPINPQSQKAPQKLPTQLLPTPMRITSSRPKAQKAPRKPHGITRHTVDNSSKAKRMTKQLELPRKRARFNAAPQRSPVPSIAFLDSVSTLPTAKVQAQAEGSTPDVSTNVEAFVTTVCKQKGGSTTQRIEVEELEQVVPVTLVKNFLPEQFADHLLTAFLEEGKRWRTSKRWLYDKEIESSRLQSGFRFGVPGRPDAHNFDARWESAGFGDDLRHLRTVIIRAVQVARQRLRSEFYKCQSGTVSSADGEILHRPPDPNELAQEMVALASRGQRLNTESANWLVRYAQNSRQQGAWRWEPNYVVSNLYQDEADFLGQHSDPVGSIGPWAIVGSVTLGAARKFSMRPVGTVWSKCSNSSMRGRVTSYSIRLPHNSLLILWEGFQEFWRHEVPKDKGLTQHPIAGPVRLNFTFRKTVYDVNRRSPNCLCGRRTRLKPVLKETSHNKGRYFWSCATPRVKKGQYQSCDFFRWDDELLAENQAKQHTNTMAKKTIAKHGSILQPAGVAGAPQVAGQMLMTTAGVPAATVGTSSSAGGPPIEAERLNVPPLAATPRASPFSLMPIAPH